MMRWCLFPGILPVFLTVTSAAAQAADACAPLRDTDTYAQCQRDQLQREFLEGLPEDRAIQGDARLETPLPTYRIRPDGPRLFPGAEGLDLQGRKQLQNSQRLLQQQTLQRQNQVGRSLRTAPPPVLSFGRP